MGEKTAIKDVQVFCTFLFVCTACKSSSVKECRSQILTHMTPASAKPAAGANDTGSLVRSLKGIS